MPRVKQDLSEISVEPEYTEEDLAAEEGDDDDDEEEEEEKIDGEEELEDEEEDDEQPESESKDEANSNAEAFQAKLDKYRTGGNLLTAAGEGLGDTTFGVNVFLNAKNKRTLAQLESEKKEAESGVKKDVKKRRKRTTKKG